MPAKWPKLKKPAGFFTSSDKTTTTTTTAGDDSPPVSKSARRSSRSPLTSRSSRSTRRSASRSASTRRSKSSKLRRSSKSRSRARRPSRMPVVKHERTPVCSMVIFGVACCIITLLLIATFFLLAVEPDLFYSKYKLTADTKSRQERVAKEFGEGSVNIGGNDLGSSIHPQHTWQIPTEDYHPSHYHLDLHVYLPTHGTPIPAGREFSFFGVVKITLTVDKPQKHIELHSAGLDLIAATLIHGKTDTKHRRLTIRANDTLSRVALSDGFDIDTGVYVLQIVYSGMLSRSMHGLYRSVYHDEVGKKKWIATTQFESTNAREMVPCFDEPRFKATWTFSIRHPIGTTATSNARIDGTPTSEEHNGLKWQRTNFETTPRLSTYIIAIIIHDFGSRFAVTNKGIGVYSRKEMMPHTQTALDAAMVAVPALENLTGVDYPLKKLDIFAIPDFAAGAMENWGIMTFRESASLYDPSRNGESRRIAVQDTVAHEIGHQWFGDLVTPEWWGDLWLNEGFATFSELYVARQFGRDIGEWGHPDTPGIQKFRKVWGEGDYAAPLKPIVVGKAAPVDRDYNKVPSTYYDILDMFSYLVYPKAAYGVYTMFTTLGEKRFSNMIKGYLEKHAYGSSITADIWDEDPIKDQLWQFARDASRDHNYKRGHPRITVARFPGTTNKYAITTQRHYLSDDTLLGDAQNDIWRIPIEYPEQPDDIMAFIPGDGSSLIIESSQLPFINQNQLVFARVNYGELWPEVLKTIQTAGLTGLTRSFIYEDLFTLARDGVVPYSTVVSFLNHLDQELFVGARSSLISGYKGIKARILEYSTSNRTATILKNASDYYNSLIAKAKADGEAKNPGGRLLKTASTATAELYLTEMEKINAFNEELREQQQMRLLGRETRAANDPEWRRFERDVMTACPHKEQMTSKCSRYDWAARNDGYPNAIRNAKGKRAERIAEFIWKKLEIETDPDEQYYLNRALLYAPNWKWAERMLDNLINNTGMARLQNTQWLASAVGWRDEAFKYLYHNIGTIYQRLSYAPDERKNLVTGILGQLGGPDALTKLTMMRQHPELPEDLRPLPFWEALAEQHRLNLKWSQSYAYDVLELFAQLPQMNTP